MGAPGVEHSRRLLLSGKMDGDDRQCAVPPVPGIKADRLDRMNYTSIVQHEQYCAHHRAQRTDLKMEHKLLIANRGEIALRIIRSARKLRVPTVGIYTLADAASPHVTQADEAYSIGDGTDPRGYLHIDAIVELAKRCRATMIAPGYGFLSENAVSSSSVSFNHGSALTRSGIRAKV